MGSTQSPTSRLLELLELLQTRPLVSGREVAERFGIDRRTVRRDIAALQELGIPVEGERGLGGGYRLRPGFRMPPLMLTEGETAAIVVALTAARRLGLGLGEPDGATAALAKIHRVLPDSHRRRAEALETVLTFTSPAMAGTPPTTDTALQLAQAIQDGQRVLVRYLSHRSQQTDRELSPFGLVIHQGRWYLGAHDHGREALRTFRVDRIRNLRLGATAAAPPDGFDAVEFVSRSLAQAPWQWDVEVILDLPIDEARKRIPATLAELADDEGNHGTTIVRLRADSLDWAAGVFVGLGVRFRVRRPDELRVRINDLGQQLIESARA